jgi:hypothetical protein
MNEAPVPFAMKTPDSPGDTITNDDTKKEELIKFKEFQFKRDNKLFIIKISMTSDQKYLYIQSKEEGIFAYIFEIKMSYLELIKFDKIFKTCEDIEDAYNSMVVIFQNEKNGIKEINDNQLILSIYILNLDSTYREKNLELSKKCENKDVIIENLCTQYNELKSVNKKISDEFNKIKNDNNNLKESINSIMAWKNEMTTEINTLKEKVNNYEFRLYKMDSNIINNQKDYDFIIERLKKVNPNKTEIVIGLRLLYRATRDGDAASDFHSRCDKVNNTLVVVKTKEGLKFGGFTTETWEGDDVDKTDNKAFCFSLDKMKIYNCIKGKRAIFASPYSGPAFENCSFQIKDKCLEDGGECSDSNTQYFDNQEKEYEINNGGDQFKVEEVEVFGVSFY